MKAKKKKAPPKVMVQASAQTDPSANEKPNKAVVSKVETAVQVQSFVEEEKKEPEKPRLTTSASQVSPRKIGSYEL